MMFYSLTEDRLYISGSGEEILLEVIVFTVKISRMKLQGTDCWDREYEDRVRGPIFWNGLGV